MTWPTDGTVARWSQILPRLSHWASTRTQFLNLPWRHSSSPAPRGLREPPRRTCFDFFELMAFVVPLTLPIPDKILVRGREKIGYGKRIVALSTSCKHHSWSGSWASWPPSRTVTGYLPGLRLACPSRTLFWRPTPLPSRQPTGAHGGSCPHQSSRSRPAARLSERSTYGHPASRPGIRRSLSSRYSISKSCRARLPKGAAPPAKQSTLLLSAKAALSDKDAGGRTSPEVRPATNIEAQGQRRRSHHQSLQHGNGRAWWRICKSPRS